MCKLFKRVLDVSCNVQTSLIAALCSSGRFFGLCPALPPPPSSPLSPSARICKRAAACQSASQGEERSLESRDFPSSVTEPSCAEYQCPPPSCLFFFLSLFLSPPFPHLPLFPSASLHPSPPSRTRLPLLFSLSAHPPRVTCHPRPQPSPSSSPPPTHSSQVSAQGRAGGGGGGGRSPR